MSLRQGVEDATNRWIDTGKTTDRLRMEGMFLLWRMVRPTAGLGFMLGALSTAGMLWIAAPLLQERPLLAAVLIGAEIAGLAWVWQLYWKGEAE